MSNKTILVLPDLHLPYAHEDAIPFLKAVKRKYTPTRVISVGDEVDNHAMSFHDSDPDLPSAGDELMCAIEDLKKLYKIFPKVDLVDSNHGSMAYRKGKHHGIPRKYIRDYNEILEAPKGWKWHNTMTIKLPTGQDLFICHGMKKNGKQFTGSMGSCTVQGHYHTEFSIQYSSSPSQLTWAAMVGCLIDDDSMAFHYNKVTPSRPILGCLVIQNGIPHLVPMIIDKETKRWNRKVY